MRYPRIYSISTVGILKHYNHDYLLHGIRTDFTGNNGVGKSIIADLLQIIFVPDRKHIVFGTEGLKKEERQIHSLPHSSSEAYTFLNVEIKKDLFIVIGVCIPNSSSRPLKPFVILSDADTKKQVSETAIPKNSLLTHRTFIVNGKIPLIEDLAKHLRDQYKLYINYYTYKEDRNEYYSFLFNNKILPINLSIEDNLAVFAKIIQSFSRARSLDVNKSESLKRFLFEDKEELYEKQFKNHKADLERLLNDYKSMDDFIKDIEQKQKELSDIKTKEEKSTNAQKIFFTTSLKHLFNEKLITEKKLRSTKNQLTTSLEKRKLLESRIPKYVKLESLSSSLVRQSKDWNTQLSKYREAHSGYLSLTKNIQSLSNLNYPSLEPFEAKEINIDEYTVSDITRRVKEFNEIFSIYGSISKMSQKCTEQMRAVEAHKQNLGREIESLQEIVKLMEHDKEKTLFSQVLHEKKALTVEQEQILFSLLDVKWGKPAKVESNVRYTESLKAINAEDIVEDQSNNGFWHRLGALNRFFSYGKEKRLFNKPANLEQAIASKIEDLKSIIEAKKEELIELDKFAQGDSYNFKNLTITYSLDSKLRDYSSLNQFKESAKITLRLTEKIAADKIQQQEQFKTLTDLKKVLPYVDDNIEHMSDTIQKFAGIREARWSRVNKLKIEEDNNLKNLNDEIIPLLNKQVEEKEKSYNGANLDYIEKDLNVKNIFPDWSIDYNEDEVIIKRAVLEDEAKYNLANKDYITEYKSIVSRYPESKNRTNPEVNEQLDKGGFGFSILEKVLLGPKIKHVDNIASALRDANQNRLTMATTIHETMLKIFSQTKSRYSTYQTIIQNLNTFFKGKKISNQHYFQIHFNPQKEFDIDWISKLQSSSQRVYKNGEIPFGDTVEQFVEDFFKKATGYKKRIHLSELLDPKTYFDLAVSLTDENNKEIPGSTGETYSAIVLLGIGRLSIVQESKREGLRFIILEETANLDRVNFNTFPNIAEEFGYQIITMTPRPYGSDSEQGWYLHHLLPGANNSNINYPETASYFKTNEDKKDLKTYLQALDDELEYIDGTK